MTAYMINGKCVMIEREVLRTSTGKVTVILRRDDVIKEELWTEQDLKN